MAHSRRLAVSALASILLAVAVPAGAQAAEAGEAQAGQTRYSLVNGCYALRSQSLGRFVAKDGAGYRAAAASAGAAEPFRMQATALGSYLLYGKDRDFLAIDGGNVVSAAGASPSADWRVEPAGPGGFRLLLPSAGRALGVDEGGKLVAVGADSSSAATVFSFETAGGCPRYPEIDTNATGTPAGAPLAYGEVRGLVDLHMHQMSFEFFGGRAHCGRPWHPYGVEYAMVDCPDHYPANGAGAVLENVLYGNPARTHDPIGWPTFRDWPHRNSLTHEQTYYKWVERAWRGGLRSMVALLTENRVLCEVYPYKKNSCNEMDSVRLQARRMRQLEDYIDAQSGGPGKGWYRIVTDPFQARRVIAQGKLAVILGMEISEPFGCRVYNEEPKCDRAQIAREMDEVYGLGVRQMELINKFDNALAGVAGDAGTQGVVVNNGNKLATGKFWQMQACDGPPDESDKEYPGAYEHDNTDLISNGLEALLPPGLAPVYPRGAQCNARGLTALGDFAVRRLADKGMIVDPDHLSVLARKGTVNVLEAERHGGVVSSHSWSTPDLVPRLYKLGGLLTPMGGTTTRFVSTWRKARPRRDRRFYFGFGYGADMGGFANQGDPRSGPNEVTYPFKSFDGKVTLGRQQSGSRVFDYTKDGMAHYGLYPDWLEDLRKLGGPRIVDDMSRGAEAYLQMWERSVGIPWPRCRVIVGRFGRRGLGRARLGMRPLQLLRRAGQPRRRTRTWRYCVRARKGPRRRMAVVFTPGRRVGLVASTGKGHEALHVGPRDRAGRLKGRARRIGRGLWVRRVGRRGTRYVFGVRRGRVRYVAVASRSVAKSGRRLRSYLRRAGLR